MQSGSKHIAILGMAAAVAGAMSGTRGVGVVPNQERARKYYDPAGRKGRVPGKTSRGKRARQTRGRRG